MQSSDTFQHFSNILLSISYQFSIACSAQFTRALRLAPSKVRNFVCRNSCDIVLFYQIFKCYCLIHVKISGSISKLYIACKSNYLNCILKVFQERTIN